VARIDDSVDIDISVASLTPSRTSFGIPLIAIFHTAFAELVKSYGSIDEVADDFGTDEATYMAAAAIFSQNPAPSTVKIGRLGSGGQTARVVKLDPNVINSTAYAVSIDGTEYSITSDANATAAEIVDALVSAINAGSQAITASNASDKLTLTGDVAGVDFFVGVGDIALWTSIQDTSTGRGSDLTTDLADIEASDSDWYGLVLTRSNAADTLSVAAWIEARTKVFFPSVLNWGAIVSAENNLSANGTNGLFDLNAASYTRTFPLFSKHDDNFQGAALAGRLLALDPGSYTAKFKTLAGVTVDDLTSTEEAAIETYKGNHYLSVASNSILQEGTASSGRFIDLTIFLDWLYAEIQSELFAAQLLNDKVPFTQGGMNMLGGCVRKALRRGVDIGGLDADSLVVSVPTLSSLATADKAARYLNAIRFTADYVGAVHKVRIVGKVVGA